MDILFVNYEFPPLGGGAGKAMASLAKELVKRGHKVRVLTTQFNDLPALESVNGYTVIRIKTLRGEIDRSNPKELFAFMLASLPAALRESIQHRPDITVVFFGIPSGPAALLLKLIFRTPYIVSLRGMDVPGFRVDPRLAIYNSFMRLAVRPIWRWSSAVIANSYGLQKLAHQTVPKQEITVIPNGVNLDQFGPRVSSANRYIPHLLFVGRLVKQKGLNYLLRSLQLVDVPYHLWIVGDGSERAALESDVIEMGLKDHVSFFGWQPYDQIAPFYNDADIFVLPSEAEGMPNVVLEAMACGLPVVATQVSGTEELIDPLRNGILVPPRDASALAKALVLLLTNAELRTQLSQEALETAKKHSWESCASQYESLIKSVLKSRKPA